MRDVMFLHTSFGNCIYVDGVLHSRAGHASAKLIEILSKLDGPLRVSAPWYANAELATWIAKYGFPANFSTVLEFLAPERHK